MLLLCLILLYLTIVQLLNKWFAICPLFVTPAHKNEGGVRVYRFNNNAPIRFYPSG